MSNEDVTNYQAEGANVRNCNGLLCNCVCRWYENALGDVSMLIYTPDGNNQYK